MIKEINKSEFAGPRIFSIWKTIEIGGIAKEILAAEIAQRLALGKWAQVMMTDPSFLCLQTKERIALIDLTPTDLGYVERPSMIELFNPERLKQWSMNNLSGHEIRLCPAEVGPHLFRNYEEQPKSDVVRVAMDAIVGPDGRSRIFTVECAADGRRELDTDWACPDNFLSIKSRIVFHLYPIGI